MFFLKHILILVINKIFFYLFLRWQEEHRARLPKYKVEEPVSITSSSETPETTTVSTCTTTSQAPSSVALTLSQQVEVNSEISHSVKSHDYLPKLDRAWPSFCHANKLLKIIESQGLKPCEICLNWIFTNFYTIVLISICSWILCYVRINNIGGGKGVFKCGGKVSFSSCLVRIQLILILILGVLIHFIFVKIIFVRP